MKTLTSSGYCGAIFIANKVEGRIEMKGVREQTLSVVPKQYPTSGEKKM